MRRLGFLTMAVLLGLALAGPALSQQAVPGGYSVMTERPLAQGVDLMTMERSAPNVDAYVARVTPGGPAQIRAVSAKDRIPHDDAGLEDPSDMCRRIDCTVAINADFRYPDDVPIGGVVVDGRMLRSPLPGRPQISVTDDGRLHSDPLAWSGVLRPSAGSMLGINGVNVRPAPDDLVLFTRAWGDVSTFGGGVELVLQSRDRIGELNRPSRVDLVALRPAGGPIPKDGAVLFASGGFVPAVEELWNRVTAGTVSRRADVRIDTPLPVLQSVGAFPVLLRDGQKVFTDDAFARARHPRTLLGWNEAGEVYFVAIDGRKRDSRGMNLSEASDFLLGLGATQGVNFDGGGGTTFVVDDQVLNDPSDANERAAVNVLAVVAPPLPPPPPDPAQPGGPVVGGASTGAPGATSPVPGPDGSPVAGPGTAGVLVDAGTIAAAVSGNQSGDVLSAVDAPAGAGADVTAGAPAGGRAKGKGNGRRQAEGSGSGGDSWSPDRDRPDGASAPAGGDDQILALGDGSPAEPVAGQPMAVAALALTVTVLVLGLGGTGVARWRRGEPILALPRRRRP